MKKAILIALAALLAALSIAAIGTTHWTGKSDPHRHLKREMLKFYNLHLKVRHGIVRR